MNKIEFLIVALLFVFYSCDKYDDLYEELAASPNAAYYSNNNEAVRRVLTIKKGNLGGNNADWYNRFLITHISDPHIFEKSKDNGIFSNSANCCKNLREAVFFSNQLKRDSNIPLLGINCIVTTGDLISNSSSDDKSAVSQRFDCFMKYYNEKNSIPSLFCTGNHDWGITSFNLSQLSNRMTSDDIFMHLTSSLNTGIKNKYGRNYFYKDISNPCGGYIRFISLDMLDQSDVDYNTFEYATYSQNQIDWLCSVALKENMTDQHSVIILNHYPFPSKEFENKVHYYSDGAYTHDWYMIPEIVEAFRTKKQLHAIYKDKFNYKDIEVNVDFAAVPGEFVCYLGGHSHVSVYFHITGFPNISSAMSSQLMILCTNQAPDVIGKIYNKVNREVGTVTSNAFHIYALDTKEGNIYITYFGAFIPFDDLQKPEIEKISYR
ncbi:MAG: metallophosphoesterase [Bacteroidales bacterium]|nr:metallophosphoesterase [Bacteroidales bacterium]